MCLTVTKKLFLSYLIIPVAVFCFYLDLDVGRRQFPGVRTRRSDVPQTVLGVEDLLRVVAGRWRL